MIFTEFWLITIIGLWFWFLYKAEGRDYVPSVRQPRAQRPSVVSAIHPEPDESTVLKRLALKRLTSEGLTPREAKHVLNLSSTLKRVQEPSGKGNT